VVLFIQMIAVAIAIQMTRSSTDTQKPGSANTSKSESMRR